MLIFALGIFSFIKAKLMSVSDLSVLQIAVNVVNGIEIVVYLYVQNLRVMSNKTSKNNPGSADKLKAAVVAESKKASKIDNIFIRAFVAITKARVASQRVDTGLRSTGSGALYSDKSIFYKRPDVLKVLADVKEAVPSLIHSEDK